MQWGKSRTGLLCVRYSVLVSQQTYSLPGRWAKNKLGIETFDLFCLLFSCSCSSSGPLDRLSFGRGLDEFANGCSERKWNKQCQLCLLILFRLAKAVQHPFSGSCAEEGQSDHLLGNMRHYLRHVTFQPVIPFRVDGLFKLYKALRCRLAQVISEAGCIVCQCRIVLSEWRHVDMRVELVSKTQDKTGQGADMNAMEHENK